MTRPAALVTGASSGIGRELALVLASEGHDLVLTARSERDLRTLADETTGRRGVRAEIVPADLSDPVAVQALAERIDLGGLAIDVLVNNAGFGDYGPFVDQDPVTQRDMIAVNVAALTDLARRFAPPMVARGRGRILNVASTAAFQPGPRMAVYYATKAYVLSLSVALSVELGGTGVTVTALCPGPTKTGFADRSGAARAAIFDHGDKGMDPVTVARAGYDAMMAGDRIVVPGTMNKLGAFASRLVPRGVAARAVRRLQAPVER